MHPMILPLLAALFLLLSAEGTQAFEKVDPKQVRIITPHSATSDCIDVPKSPVCAVETFLACTRRIDKPMCARIGITNFQYQDKPEEKFRYRILSVRVLAKRDISKEDWAKPNGIRPGDVEVIVQEPDEHPPACPKSGCETSFWVKPDGIDWRVSSWVAWGMD
jgi:hypothetical protein